MVPWRERFPATSQPPPSMPSPQSVPLLPSWGDGKLGDAAATAARPADAAARPADAAVDDEVGPLASSQDDVRLVVDEYQIPGGQDIEEVELVSDEYQHPAPQAEAMGSSICQSSGSSIGQQQPPSIGQQQPPSSGSSEEQQLPSTGQQQPPSVGQQQQPPSVGQQQQPPSSGSSGQQQPPSSGSPQSAPQQAMVGDAAATAARPADAAARPADAAAAFPIGMSVTIAVRNKEYANSGVWMVVNNEADRTILAQTDPEGKRRRISVRSSACHSLALCLHRPVPPMTVTNPMQDHSQAPLCGVPPSQGGMDVQDFLVHNAGRSECLNKWIPLPGMRGNSIMLVARGPLGVGVEPLAPGSTMLRARGLLSWPRLTALNIGVRFRSESFKCEHDFEFFDVLAWCPQDHVWIFCAWCGKFHFPCEGGHRESKKHQRALEWMRRSGPEYMVEEMAKCGWRHGRQRFL